MSIWDKLKNRLREAVESEEEEENARAEKGARIAGPPVSASGVSSSVGSARGSAADPFARFERFGLPGGPSERDVLDALLQARQGEDESRALAAVLAAGERLTEALRAECADILVVRGEEDRALELLAPCLGAGALMLAADLFASRGELARALGSIERVLARDLAAPGALERHRRWSEALGATFKPTRRLDEATMVASAPTDTPYRIDREVARGGAGSVYEAFDEVLERKVAFKAYHGGGDDRVSLEREVQLAARFAGPGVVRVLDASPHGGWVALEWASQGSLRDWLRAGRIDDLFPVVRWATPLARALARVHAGGFVHSDVKPTNVLLQGPNAPLLSDFGIARPNGAPAAGGSAGYVSPERLGGAVSAFSDDVYGFGRTVEDVLAIGPERATVGLSRLVSRCLAPASERPRDAAALVELLAALGQS